MNMAKRVREIAAMAVFTAIAFAGFPGEPFTAYGVMLKKMSPFTMTIPSCLVNDERTPFWAH